jgi:alpha-N-arabinofuranosidase
VNASSAPQPISIQLDGAADVEKNGQLVTLSATNTQETNSLADPERIIPVERTIQDAAATFTQILPPYSIQVLELHAK